MTHKQILFHSAPAKQFFGAQRSEILVTLHRRFAPCSRTKRWLDANTLEASLISQTEAQEPMLTFFFAMKDGVPLRDRVGIKFNTNSEAIEHRNVLAKHFREDNLRNDQDLEITVVNSLRREIHREFVHGE